MKSVFAVALTYIANSHCILCLARPYYGQSAQPKQFQVLMYVQRIPIYQGEIGKQKIYQGYFDKPEIGGISHNIAKIENRHKIGAV